MADHNSVEGSSGMHHEMRESTVEINIKTLDSQIYRCQADKNMLVSAFKERIASQIGVPMEQQRLIFRGKVLNDTHLLSEYHLENGDTLHLVVRQPSQAQPSSGSNSADATTNNNGRGQEPGLGAPRGRIGQISHSVVLGTFNAGEQGEGGLPDLSRVIGAVLNSIGVGNQAGAPPNMLFNPPLQNPQTTETAGRGETGSQGQTGNPTQSGHPLSGQSVPRVVQIPLGAAIAVPSFNMPIPDSVNTLSEFMSRMEFSLSQHAGNQPGQSPNDTVNIPRVELPSNRGVPTPDALSLVIRQAHRLISGPAAGSLSRIAGRLEQEAGSTDPSVRGQIQTESVQVGLSMQHLGALLLELGRTILTLRMGHSPAESSVNAGPAVYISPFGPNPIMVQPFPLQMSPLLAGPAANVPHPSTTGPVGIGSIPRNVNIHIHAGASMAPFVPGVGARATTGEATQGEHVTGTGFGGSRQSQASPLQNIGDNAVPTGPTVIAMPGIGVDAPQLPSQSLPLSAMISEANSQLQTLVDNTRNENQASSGQVESSTTQDQFVVSVAGNDVSTQQNIPFSNGVGGDNLPIPGFSRPEEDEAQSQSEKCCPDKDSGITVGTKSETPSSSMGTSNFKSDMPKVPGEEEGGSVSRQGMYIPDGSSSVPLGLGLGGLQPKRRVRRSTVPGNSTEGSSVAPNSMQQPQARIVGQQVLESLASLTLSGRSNASAHASEQLSHSTERNMDSVSTGDHNGDDQLDVSNALSQALQSPALNGLLAGVSQQAGIGSPNVLRNMLEQITQSPAMRNTVNQIAQQIDNNDIGNMLSGMGGEGGGFDMSRIFQQMMPIVSQALGGVSSGIPSAPQVGTAEGRRSVVREAEALDENSQLDLHGLAQRIGGESTPGEIFTSMVRNVTELCSRGNGPDSVLNELCNDGGLATEFVEILRHDVARRLQE